MIDDIKTNIEVLIDKLTINSFLEVVETICEEKAEHIENNWGDQPLAQPLARRWMRVARTLRIAAEASTNL